MSVAVGLLLRRCATLAVGYIDSRRDFFWLQARDEPTGEEVRQLTASRFLRCVFHNNNNREPTNQPTKTAVASRSRRAKGKQKNCATKEEKNKQNDECSLLFIKMILFSLFVIFDY